MLLAHKIALDPNAEQRLYFVRAAGTARVAWNWALAARYNKDQAWESRCDAFTRVSDHVPSLIGARAGAAVIPLRG